MVKCEELPDGCWAVDLLDPAQKNKELEVAVNK